MYSQGISPRLDFSDLSDTVALVCRCNESQLPVRLPYAGELVFSAFAGTHQDAIKKGLDAQAVRWAEVDRSGQDSKHWAMPYVPLDPKDLGYGYENLIRVSSQSGKAGTAHVIKQTMLLDLPRRMQVTFYKVIQDQSERTGKEMTAALITSAFKQTYALDSKTAGRLFMHSSYLRPVSLPAQEPLSSISNEKPHSLPSNEPLLHFEGDFSVDGRRRVIHGEGRGLVLAILDAFRTDLGFELSIGELEVQAIEEDSARSKSVTFIELLPPESSPAKSGAGSVWGVGISSDETTSKCQAVVSATNQLVGDVDFKSPTNIMSAKPSPSVVFGGGWFTPMKSRAGRFLIERFGWFLFET
jgi:2-isopropylmalate synthase